MNVKYIVDIKAANAWQVRKYCRDRNIMRHYIKFASDKETRSMVILDNGVVCSLSFTAEDLLDQVKQMREPMAHI